VSVVARRTGCSRTRRCTAASTALPCSCAARGRSAASEGRLQRATGLDDARLHAARVSRAAALGGTGCRLGWPRVGAALRTWPRRAGLGWRRRRRRGSSPRRRRPCTCARRRGPRPGRTARRRCRCRRRSWHPPAERWPASLCCVLGLVGWWAGGLGASRPARHRAAAPTWAEPQSNPHSRLRPHPALH